MVKLSTLYQKTGNRISSYDLEDIKQPLTISFAEIVGKTKRGVLLEFNETTLKHKCNKNDIKYFMSIGIDDTDKLKGQKISLVEKETKTGNAIRIKQEKKTISKK